MTSAVSGVEQHIGAVDAKTDVLANRVNALGHRVDKVGAGAAALAALHPLDFDIDNKWDITAGYGWYGGESAVAIGTFYRPNEDLMLSLGTALGNGETMWNAGVSIKVGYGDSEKTVSRGAMVRRIGELESVVAFQNEKITSQENEIKELKAMMQQILAK